MATYQTTAPYINDTLAHYLAWATAFGQAFTTFGWQAQSGHGEVVASGTGATYAWTNVAVFAMKTVPAVVSYTFGGAFIPSHTYVGGSTNADSSVPIVTFSGLTYVHITASSSLATTPDSDTTNWAPYNYEIWKSQGSNTTSLPIFVRIAYVGSSTPSGPRILMSIGTGIDSSGNVNNPAVVAPASPFTTTLWDNAAVTSTSFFDMDFSGDADNFRCIVWRGAGNTQPGVLFIDRSKTSTGTDSDAFVYIGVSLQSGSTMYTRNAIIPHTSIGSALNQTATGWVGVIFNGANNGSLLTFGSSPPFPIFPLIGFVANPCLGAVCFEKADVTDGTIYSVWLYGSSHYYLVSTSQLATGITASPINVSNSLAPAILWE